MASHIPIVPLPLNPGAQLADFLMNPQPLRQQQGPGMTQPAGYGDPRTVQTSPVAPSGRPPISSAGIGGGVPSPLPTAGPALGNLTGPTRQRQGMDEALATAAGYYGTDGTTMEAVGNGLAAMVGQRGSNSETSMKYDLANRELQQEAQLANATVAFFRKNGRSDLEELASQPGGAKAALSIFEQEKGNPAYGPEADPGKKFNETRDTNLANYFDKLILGGEASAKNTVSLSSLEARLKNAPQGAKGAFVSFANSLGLAVAGGDDVAAAEAIISSMVPDQRPAGSGTMSDADLALFKASLPRIINQPGGNALIIGTLKRMNELDSQIAAIAFKANMGDTDPRAAYSQIRDIRVQAAQDETLNAWRPLAGGGAGAGGMKSLEIDGSPYTIEDTGGGG